MGDGALVALGATIALAGLRSLSLAGCEDVGDAGVAAVAQLLALTCLDLRNCCKARACGQHPIRLAPCLLRLDPETALS